MIGRRLHRGRCRASCVCGVLGPGRLPPYLEEDRRTKGVSLLRTHVSVWEGLGRRELLTGKKPEVARTASRVDGCAEVWLDGDLEGGIAFISTQSFDILKLQERTNLWYWVVVEEGNSSLFPKHAMRVRHPPQLHLNCSFGVGWWWYVDKNVFIDFRNDFGAIPHFFWCLCFSLLNLW